MNVVSCLHVETLFIAEQCNVCSAYNSTLAKFMEKQKVRPDSTAFMLVSSCAYCTFGCFNYLPMQGNIIFCCCVIVFNYELECKCEVFRLWAVEKDAGHGSYEEDHI